MSYLLAKGFDIYLIWITVAIAIYGYHVIKFNFREIEPYEPIEVVSHAIYVIFIGIIYTLYRLFF